MSEKVKTAFGWVEPETQFMPPNWGQMVLDNFLAGQERAMRYYDMIAGIDPDNRPTTIEERPADPHWLAKRKKFKKRWKRMVKDGLREGWLEHDHCYECGGELKVTTNTTDWVTIPNPDYDPDKPNPYAKEIR